MFKEQQNKKDFWKPSFYKDFPGFASITPFVEKWLGQAYPHWPSIDDFNRAQKADIHFVLQEKEMRYLWEIHQNRHIPTRLYNWHDLFNNITWLIFPKIKAAIVAKMCCEPFEGKSRSSVQNLLAHFDECGVVICADDVSLFALIEHHCWLEFFLKEDLKQHCLPVLFGHGLMEKALTPFIGMTAKTLFLQVDPCFFTMPTSVQNDIVDEKIAQFILSDAFPRYPKALHPFPLLGWPDWHPQQNDAFYLNKSYFRDKNYTT